MMSHATIEELLTDGRPSGPGVPRQRLRHYLMCRPSHFDVRYSINPWMHPDRPTSTRTAVRQWSRLFGLLKRLGHRVDVIDAVPGLPDMVFAANGATVIDGKALVARFRHPERADEATQYLSWFRGRGYPGVAQAGWANEGEGDLLATGSLLLAGTGFRTDARAHDEAQEFFGRPVVSLGLVDPRFYHLDTALAVLADDDVMYLPEAFSAESVEVLRALFPHALEAKPDDAEVFGLNAVSDGLNVVLPTAAVRLAARLRERSYRTFGVDLSELLKAGGGAKCCTLELRSARSPQAVA
jgi:N-dimethylarginine dimethylaminohydrolase